MLKRVDIKSLKNKYLATEWYKQEAAVKPLYIGFPWHACYAPMTAFHKKLPVSFSGMVTYYHDNYFEVYFPKSLMKKITLCYYSRQRENPGFARKLKKHWETHDCWMFDQAETKIHAANLSNLDSKALLSEFFTFSSMYTKLWREAIFLDSFDVYGEQLLENVMKHEGLSLDNSITHRLTALEDYSWIQKEKISLLKLAKTAGQKPVLKKALQSPDTMKNLRQHSPDFSRALSAHARKFHWIYNDYAVVKNLDERYFAAQIIKLLKNPEAFRHEQEQLPRVKKVKNLKQALIKKLKLPKKIAEATAFITCLAQWRDSRKAYNQKAGAVLRKFGMEFARRTELPLESVEQIFWFEMKNIYRFSGRDLAFMEKRSKGAFFPGDIVSPKGTVTGKPAARLLDALEKTLAKNTSLSGKTAYPGIVTGKVAIVRNQHEFHKMKKGYILVAPNTRPEYVPIMKLAGAIITIEGGITSHAAIVSRELRIPCIVGVQSALQKLKDGDTVEVNADEGSVKKL